MSKEYWYRKVDNARIALENSTTQWATRYWQNVLSYLLRRANRET